MLVTSLPECVLFLGLYFIGGKVEKLINAPVRAFSQQTQANFYMRQRSSVKSMTRREYSLEGHWHTSLGNSI